MSSFPDTLSYCTGHCALGGLLLAETADHTQAILLGDNDDAMRDDLQQRFPDAKLVRADEHQKQRLQAMLDWVDQPKGEFPLTKTAAPHGTAFQRSVWQALSKVRSGDTITYSELAKRLDKPRAVRAVASACAANPLAMAVPCHRVLRSDGGISGYRWGVERKKQLLQLEHQHNLKASDARPA